jgi:hypothetical protein
MGMHLTSSFRFSFFTRILRAFLISHARYSLMIPTVLGEEYKLHNFIM